MFSPNIGTRDNSVQFVFVENVNKIYILLPTCSNGEKIICQLGHNTSIWMVSIAINMEFANIFVENTWMYTFDKNVDIFLVVKVCH